LRFGTHTNATRRNNKAWHVVRFWRLSLFDRKASKSDAFFALKRRIFQRSADSEAICQDSEAKWNRKGTKIIIKFTSDDKK